MELAVGPLSGPYPGKRGTNQPTSAKTAFEMNFIF